MKNIRTLFIGTSDFAVPILKNLIANETFKIVGIVTQPDKPVGRKQELKMPAVKEFVVNNPQLSAVEVFQPEKIRRIGEEVVEKFKPELIIVASYGQIIPKSILDFPKYKALNFHVSLLPDLRGAIPMPMAILKGYKKTGVTMQIMAEALDEGEILATREIEIRDEMTTEDLIKIAAEVSADMVNKELMDWLDGKITPRKQDESKATYCYMSDMSKEKAEITFETDVNLAERMTRAFYPWPIAWVNLDGKMLKIYKAKVRVQTSEIRYQKMEIVKEDKSLILRLANGDLELLEVQLEGKRRDSYKNYLYLAVH